MHLLAEHGLRNGQRRLFCAELTDRSCTEKHTARNLRTVHVCSTQTHFVVTLSSVWRRLFAVEEADRAAGNRKDWKEL
ncbi:hypothetical protein SRHO_G00047150 [Serrasalmus rhombeus]